MEVFSKENSSKKIIYYGVTSKKIDEFKIDQTGKFKDGATINCLKMENISLLHQKKFKKKGKRIFVTVLSPPKFTFDNYKEVLFNEGLGQAFINT